MNRRQVFAGLVSLLVSFAAAYFFHTDVVTFLSGRIQDVAGQTFFTVFTVLSASVFLVALILMLVTGEWMWSSYGTFAGGFFGILATLLSANSTNGQSVASYMILALLMGVFIGIVFLAMSAIGSMIAFYLQYFLKTKTVVDSQ